MAEAEPERMAESPPDLQTQIEQKPRAAALLLPLAIPHSTKTSAAWDLVDLAALTEIDVSPQPAAPALMKLLGHPEIQMWPLPVVPEPQQPAGSKADQGEIVAILKAGRSSTCQVALDLVEAPVEIPPLIAGWGPGIGGEQATPCEWLPTWAIQAADLPEMVNEDAA